MAADPGGEGYRCGREEGQEDRAVQSVEGDCLGAVAEGRDMRGRGLMARGRQDTQCAPGEQQEDGCRGGQAEGQEDEGEGAGETGPVIEDLCQHWRYIISICLYD